MSFEPPRIEQVDRIDYRFEPRSWRFAIDEAAGIDAYWAQLRSRNPRFFNGRVLIMHSGAIEAEADQRVLRGECFEVDYKAFLAWREFGFPDAAVRNCFAMAALRTSDGAFMLGRMADHTANPGRLYFPAGTPDRADLQGTKVDLEGSALRELAEETGIEAAQVDIVPGWTIVLEGPRVACMKLVRSPLTAARLAARFAAFQAAEAEPELVALEPVFGLGDLDVARMPDFMLSYLRYALSGVTPESGSRAAPWTPG